MTLVIHVQNHRIFRVIQVQPYKAYALFSKVFTKLFSPKRKGGSIVSSLHRRLALQLPADTSNLLHPISIDAYSLGAWSQKQESSVDKAKPRPAKDQ